MWRSWRARTGHLFREWSVLRVRMSAQSADLSTVPEKRALVLTVTTARFLELFGGHYRLLTCHGSTRFAVCALAKNPRLWPSVQASPILQAIAQATPPGDMPEKKKSSFWAPPRSTIGRHLLHKPRDAEPSSPLRISLPKSLDPTQFLGTSQIYHRTSSLRRGPLAGQTERWVPR